MIKLERNFTPEFFNQENVTELTEKFKNDETAVWQHPEVKSACLKLSNNKCAFCEVKLEEASTYIEVEHFKDKKTYPDDVIQWDNLLPSCRNCNGSKQRHDVMEHPIINPCLHVPSDHLFLRGYRIKGKTPLGNETVETLNFNHRDHKFIPRCKAGEVIDQSIDDAVDKLEEYLQAPHHRRKNKLMNLVEALLNECQRTAPFAAVSATVLHSSEDYAMLRQNLIFHNLWTDYMQELHVNSSNYVLSDKR